MIRLALRVRREDAEVALAELLALAPGGVEEVDDGDVVEYAVYGSPGELPALPDLQAAAGGALVEVRTTEVPDDWAERWKAFHEPVTIAGRLHVRTPWHPALEGVEEIVIDPGQAFGTGAHDTTRLCLELLCSLDAGGPLVDLGCGSGVLSIAAARLGYSPILAVDNDPLAVQATRENAAANAVALDARRVDLLRELAPSARTVVANLLRPLLLALRFEAPPERLIVSGLLPGEVDEVIEGVGLAEVRRVSSGEWAAALLEA